MKLPHFISRLFESPKRAFAVRKGYAPIPSGEQIVKDTRLLFTPQHFFVGLNPWEKVLLYESLSRSNPIANGSVSTLVRLCNTKPNWKSGNPQVDARSREIWNQVDGYRVNQTGLRQDLIAGFGITEWSLLPQPNEYKLTIPPSREIRVRADESGNVNEFVQLPGWTGQAAGIAGLRTIPRAKCMYSVVNPEHSFDYYGDSLYSSAIDQFADVAAILKAQVRVYQRLGEPRFVVEIPADGLTEEEFTQRITMTQNAMDNLKPGEDLHVPAGVKVSILGADGFGQKFRDECNYQISSILSAVGLPAAMLNLAINAGSTESWIRQIVIVLQTQLRQYQATRAAAWNRDFWPVVAALEGMPVVPVMEFAPPRLLEELQREKAREAKFLNDKREVIAGFRSLEWLAQQCDCPDIDDPEAAQEWLEHQRASGGDDETISNEETNAGSITKGSDSSATNNNNA